MWFFSGSIDTREFKESETNIVNYIMDCRVNEVLGLRNQLVVTVSYFR